jgi:iron complex transport system ATP-binding protein
MRNPTHELSKVSPEFKEGDGRIVAAGAPTEVLTPGLLREVYGVEARLERCSRGVPLLIVDGSARGRT